LLFAFNQWQADSYLLTFTVLLLLLLVILINATSLPYGKILNGVES
jgi:hypothetical protein